MFYRRLASRRKVICGSTSNAAERTFLNYSHRRGRAFFARLIPLVSPSLSPFLRVNKFIVASTRDDIPMLSIVSRFNLEANIQRLQRARSLTDDWNRVNTNPRSSLFPWNKVTRKRRGGYVRRGCQHLSPSILPHPPPYPPISRSQRHFDSGKSFFARHSVCESLIERFADTSRSSARAIKNKRSPYREIHSSAVIPGN